MYEVKAIETEYNGYLFRSRTEARWAIFLDYIGEPYEYEKECFQLPSGKYLPDFFLPKKNLWIEIKGKEPTEKEWRKCVELSWGKCAPVMCLWGTPGREKGRAYVAYPSKKMALLWEDVAITVSYEEISFSAESAWSLTEKEGWEELPARGLVVHPYPEYFIIHPNCVISPKDMGLHKDAVAYSRKARFENGVKNPRGINGTRN